MIRSKDWCAEQNGKAVLQLHDSTDFFKNITFMHDVDFVKIEIENYDQRQILYLTLDQCRILIDYLKIVTK